MQFSVLSGLRRCSWGFIRESMFDGLQNSDSNSAMSAAPPDRRRWFRFSLRTLMFALTVLCVWLGVKVNAARRQREAVQAILQAGGTVFYDYQTVPVSGAPDSFNINSSATLPVPAWLRSIFGDDFFCNVIYVSFSNGLSPDLELDRLASLPALWRLQIRSNPIAAGANPSRRSLRDADLAALAKLSQLRELLLIRQEIEGPGLQALVGLKHLKQLSLARTLINDAGLEQVGKLTTLENVVLTPDRISDAGLHYLSTIPKLNFDLMGLPSMQINDSRLEALSQLNNLDVLSLHNANFTDETNLKRLQNLRNLGGLNFLDCDVTDVGVHSLCDALRGAPSLYAFSSKKATLRRKEFSNCRRHSPAPPSSARSRHACRSLDNPSPEILPPH